MTVNKLIMTGSKAATLIGNTRTVEEKVLVHSTASWAVGQRLLSVDATVHDWG